MGSSHCAICGRHFGIMSVKLNLEGMDICAECMREYFPYRDDPNIPPKDATLLYDKIEKLMDSEKLDEKLVSYLQNYKKKLKDICDAEEESRREKLLQEQEALATEILAKDQELLNNTLLTTANTIEGRSIESYLGIVMGCVPIGMGFLTINTGDISNLFGKKSKLLENKSSSG